MSTTLGAQMQFRDVITLVAKIVYRVSQPTVEQSSEAPQHVFP